jgi:hypothetical protein
MKKGLIFGLIAVLSAAFFLAGCGQGTDDSSGSSINIGGRLVDIEVTDEPGLLAALANPDYQVIAVTGAGITLAGNVTEIPAGKTVVLYTSFEPTDQFEVKGTLVVEGNGSFIADATHRVRVTDGNIEVFNGTIEVDSVVDIHGKDIEIQILGTGKAYFAGGTLKINAPLATLDDVKTAFSWVQKGTVVIDEVTQGIKPSDLTQIPTTALRKLTITNELVTAVPPDAATSITVPKGMTFETADPLSALETLIVNGELTSDAVFGRLESLTVAGKLTVSAATFSNVTDLKVSGELDASAAPAVSYDQITSLVVDSEFNAGTKNFGNLQSLTVNKGGEFTAGSIGSPATDAAGLTITIGAAEGLVAAGSVEVASINKLKTSVIDGVLTTGSFTLLDAANDTLSVAAGGTINGVTFPAASPITSVAANTVTIDDYTVPRNETLDIGTGSTLIIPTGKVLTIAPFALASGSGVILARGSTDGGTITIDTTEGYTTTVTGVDGDTIRTAVAALIADTAKLTNSVDLKTTFYSGGSAAAYPGIGSVTISADDTATDILSGTDGTSGTVITLDAATTLDLATTVPTYAKDGTDAVNADISTGAGTAFSINSGDLQLTDDNYDGSGTDYVYILTVTPGAGTKLVNSGLINPTDVPAFNIGVATKQ